MSNFFANKQIIRLRIALSFFFRQDPKPQLGRWNIHYDLSNINSKVDLANEDHCGSCGKYAEEKHKTITESKVKTNDTEKDK